MDLVTPTYNLNAYPEVYEPREDTFILLDALEAESDLLLDLAPTVAVEIGSGSGIVIAGLSFILRQSCAYFSTDINLKACLATKNTAVLNNVSVDCLNMDLLNLFKCNIFDIIVFNPPYVVTNTEELNGLGLNRAWAGGKDGREVINKVVCKLPSLLTPNGICYMVLLKDNKLDEIVIIMKDMGFESKVVLQRKIPVCNGGVFCYKNLYLYIHIRTVPTSLVNRLRTIFSGCPSRINTVSNIIQCICLRYKPIIQQPFPLNHCYMLQYADDTAVTAFYKTNLIKSLGTPQKSTSSLLKILCNLVLRRVHIQKTQDTQPLPKQVSTVHAGVEPAR
ncbi:hypothetical protein NQ317_002821 [Molorchus minor]|uniref:Methyltransferase small domain-containing protein n=1 Tax=Molorchus minor TaxID=1323400 RepID=A0ABQ9JMM5_9CUCU|nr:hypothetical protein NQ317_002821 [Molorchus minor]